MAKMAVTLALPTLYLAASPNCLSDQTRNSAVWGVEVAQLSDLALSEQHSAWCPEACRDLC